MKKQPKVSILVPCYNVEKYLPQCLDSIVNQTLEDIEIICINDGSTDNTLNIIKDYAKRDSRIVIIDKPNEGYGKSMNRGLDAATGEYVGIVESDDWVDTDMFANLAKIADKTKVDVVKSNFYEYTTENGETNKKVYNVPHQDIDKIINPRIQSGIFWGCAAIWSAIYKRSFLIKNNVRFLETPGASYQDTAFNFKVFAMAPHAWLTEHAFLHYRCDNTNSSVKSSGKICCICDEWDEIDRYVSEHFSKTSNIWRLIPHIKYGGYLWNSNRLADAERTKFLKNRFQKDFKYYIQNGLFQKIYFDDKRWNDILLSIWPESVLLKIRKAIFNIIRPLYKTKIFNSYKEYYLFGIKIHKKQLPELNAH